jgi:transposase
MPALPTYLIEPILWEQFSALLPERGTDHPLGCHRPRISDRVVFEKLVQVLVFGCACERVADEGCSDTTLRRRRDEWIALGAMDELREMALEAYDRFVGLELSDMAVDCSITKAPCGGEKAGRSPVDRRKAGHQALDGSGRRRHPRRICHRPSQSPRLAAFGRNSRCSGGSVGRVASG